MSLDLPFTKQIKNTWQHIPKQQRRQYVDELVSIVELLQPETKLSEWNALYGRSGDALTTRKSTSMVQSKQFNLFDSNTDSSDEQSTKNGFVPVSSFLSSVTDDIPAKTNKSRTLNSNKQSANNKQKTAKTTIKKRAVKSQTVSGNAKIDALNKKIAQDRIRATQLDLDDILATPTIHDDDGFAELDAFNPFAPLDETIAPEQTTAQNQAQANESPNQAQVQTTAVNKNTATTPHTVDTVVAHTPSTSQQQKTQAKKTAQPEPEPIHQLVTSNGTRAHTNKVHMHDDAEHQLVRQPAAQNHSVQNHAAQNQAAQNNNANKAEQAHHQAQVQATSTSNQQTPSEPKIEVTQELLEKLIEEKLTQALQNSLQTTFDSVKTDITTDLMAAIKNIQK